MNAVLVELVPLKEGVVLMEVIAVAVLLMLGFITGLSNWLIKAFIGIPLLPLPFLNVGCIWESLCFTLEEDVSLLRVDEVPGFISK